MAEKTVEQQIVEQNRVSLELTEAVPPTETLNVEAQRARAELARQGSLADRNPPAVLAQVRAKQGHLSFEPDVTYEDGAPVLDILDLNSSPVSQKIHNEQRELISGNCNVLGGHSLMTSCRFQLFDPPPRHAPIYALCNCVIK